MTRVVHLVRPDAAGGHMAAVRPCACGPAVYVDLNAGAGDRTVYLVHRAPPQPAPRCDCRCGCRSLATPTAPRCRRCTVRVHRPGAITWKGW